MLAPLIQFRIVNSTSPKVPTFCPVCQFVLVDSRDVEAFENASCCRECEQQFFEPNQKAWKEGWRPENNLLQNAINARQFVSLRDK